MLYLVRGGVFFLAMSAVLGFSEGPPLSTCLTQFPKHRNQEMQFSPPPYRILLSPQDYDPGQNITVHLHGVDDRPFKGVQLSAHRTDVNREELQGTFVTWPSDKVKAMDCLYGQRNMIGHLNSEPVTNVTLTWKAPEENIGEIVFIATFVESYSVFWFNVQARLQPRNKTSVVPPPFRVAEATTAWEEIDFSACGVTKGCFLYPRTCSGADCQAAVAWQPDGASFLFEMFATAEGYVSLGFSDDRIMGGDETVTCTAQGERVSVQHGYNPAHHNDRQLMTELRGLYARQADGKVFCRFKRPRTATVFDRDHDNASVVHNITFDLTRDWHVMLAWGYTFRDTDVMRIHTELPPVTSSKVSFSTVGTHRGAALPYASQAHGAVMVVAWVLLAGMTTAVARYYRNLMPQRRLAGTKVWFQVHRALSLLVVIMTVIGTIIVFVHVGGLSKDGLVHAGIGLAVGAVSLLNAGAGLLRPGLDSSLRPAFNIGHRLLGVVALSLAAINLCLAFTIDLLPHSQRSVGLAVFLAWIGAELVWFVVFELRKCYVQSRTKQTFITDDSNMQVAEPEASAGLYSLDNILLLLYVLTVIAFTIAGLCAVLLF